MDTDVLRKLAESMRVAMSEDELAVLAEDFTSVLKLVNELDEMEIPDTEPTYVLKNVTRDDRATEVPCELRDAIVNGFPAKERDLLKVPSIF